MAYLDFAVNGNLFRFVTAHFCHSGFSDDDFDSAILDVEMALAQARGQKRAFVLGVDANAVIGKRLPADD